MALIGASLLEQCAAWAMLPRFLVKMVRGRSCYFHTVIDKERTNAVWKFDKPEHVNRLRFPYSHVRSLLFPLLHRPVYDVRAMLRPLRASSGLDGCAILLRIDDIFLAQKECVGRFLSIMERHAIPYCAGVTGNDLMNRDYAPVIGRMRASGGEIALHGFSHRGRHGPFESEILQMRYPNIEEKVRQVLGSEPCRNDPPRIFMPPFNAICVDQIAFFSRHFDIVTGGPESVRFTDRYAGPLALVHGGWYVPTAFPYYRDARALLRENIRGELRRMRGYICICLHMDEEEKDGFTAFARLLESLPSAPVSWRHFTKDTSGEAYFMDIRKDP